MIPTYRRPKLLKRAIQSVLAQNYGDYEVHVFDNASCDDTEWVVNEFVRRDTRVKYHCQPRNIGMMANFSFGISCVSTPLFSILSDDDMLLPGFYQSAACALSAHSEAAIFMGKLLYADPSGRVVHVLGDAFGAQKLVGPADMFRRLLPGEWLTWTGMVFRTRAVGAIGGPKSALGFSADVDLILRIAANYSTVVDPRPSAVFMMHPGSTSAGVVVDSLKNHLNLEQYRSIEGAIADARENGAVTEAEADLMRTMLRRLVVRNFFRRGALMAITGERVLARAVAAVVARDFGKPHLAALLRLLAADSSFGKLTRSVVDIARALRHAYRVLHLAGASDENSAIVRKALRAFDQIAAL